jgi:hypothetical protein
MQKIKYKMNINTMYKQYLGSSYFKSGFSVTQIEICYSHNPKRNNKKSSVFSNRSIIWAK